MPITSPQSASLTLDSADGQLRADLLLQGGFCHWLTYTPNGAEPMAIFHQAPWLARTDACQGLPPLMSSLAGEWVGVPFGHGAQDDGVFFADAPHGLPANRPWQLQEKSADSAVLSFTFPDDYPLESLWRTVTLHDNGAIAFSLTLVPRRDCQLPVGLHPVFPMGGEYGPLEIELSSDIGGIVYPRQVEPHISRLTPLAEFSSLRAVPCLDGGALDLTRLPLSFASEEIVQLLPPVNQVSLRWPQRRLRATLHWDNELLPGCLLWISNGGRQYAPWNGQNFCLGVEPINSAWDLGPGAQADNPLRRRGYATALALRAGQSLTCRYQLTCEPL